MRIIYIAPSFIPSRSANSVHVMKMCSAISSLGHNLYLITRGKKNTINDYFYYGVESSFKIIKLSINDLRFISSTIFSIFLIFKINQIKPDIIYTRHRLSLIITKLFNIPVIFEDHSPPISIYKHIINSSLKKNVIKIVLISNSLRKLYKRNLPSIKKIRIIVAHDGADPINNKIDSLNTLKIDKAKINCGYIGHLYKGRGINIILKTAKQLPEISFHIIGGNEKDIKYWQSKNIMKNVIFYGHIENSKIPSLLNEFDMLLAPYQRGVFLENNNNTVKWMSPLKIFEYMAAGKPIVCSNLDILKEVLEHNYNSILVDPENIKEWVQAINNLSTNISLGEKIGENAKNKFLKHYTWKKRAYKIIYD